MSILIAVLRNKERLISEGHLSPSARTSRELPPDVPYSSWKAAAILATVCLPAYGPSIFMWVDVGRRVAACGACEMPIKPGTDRLAVHISLRHGRTLPKGGLISSERSYYHPSCFDDTLVSGENAHNAISCFDCGLDPDEGKRWTGRVWAGSHQHYAFLCDGCCQAKRWYMCSSCNIRFTKSHVVEQHVDTMDVVSMTELGYDGDGHGGYWVCTGCRDRWCIATVDSVAKEHAALERREQQWQDYRTALMRGEHPENPWADEKQYLVDQDWF